MSVSYGVRYTAIDGNEVPTRKKLREDAVMNEEDDVGNTSESRGSIARNRTVFIDRGIEIQAMQ